MLFKRLFFSLFILINSLSSFSQDAQVIDSLTQELENTINLKQAVLVNYQLGKNYFRANNLTLASEHAESCYEGAKTLQLDSIVGNAANLWGIISVYQGNTDHSILLLKESNRIAHSLKDSSGITSTYSLLSNVYNQVLNDPAMAFTYIDSAEQFYQNKEVDKIVFGKIVKGTIFTHVSEYPLALKEYYSALDLSQGDTSKMVSLHINLGAVFSRMGNIESAFQHYRMGLTLNPKSEIELAILYNNIADYYHAKNKKDSTLLFINRAQSIFEKNKRRQQLFVSQLKICQYFMDFNQVEEAQNLFETIDTSGLNTKEKLMWFALGYKVAKPKITPIELTKKFETISDLIEDELYLSVTKLLSEQYNLMGVTTKALKYSQLYSGRRDSILAQEKVVLGHRVQLNRIVSAKNKVLMEAQLANEQLKVSYAIEGERRKKWRNTTLLSIALLLIILYSFRIVVKRKKEKLIYNEKELENEKRQAALLINKLERAKQSVTDKNREIELLLLNNSKASLDGTSVDKMMTNLKERNWSNFLLDFELIYPKFFEAISSHISAPLSKNERRLCALIKLNLSNKEMGEYVFVSQESVKKSKNRLYKKFTGNQSGQEISDLLRNI